MASASHDGTIKLWDTRSGQQRQMLMRHLDSVNAVAFSLDGSVVASASHDKTVKLWDMQLGQERQTLTGHSDWVHAVAFSPDGSVVASASLDKTVKLWDTRSGHDRQTLSVDLFPGELRFTSEGNHLLTDRGAIDTVSSSFRVSTSRTSPLPSSICKRTVDNAGIRKFAVASSRIPLYMRCDSMDNVRPRTFVRPCYDTQVHRLRA